MCMKNVNAVARLYNEVEMGNNPNRVSTFKNQFDIISAKFNNENNPYIGDFYIISEINLLGTAVQEDKETNIVEQQKKAKFKVRITKISDERDRQYSWDVDEFEIDTSKDGLIIEGACVPYVNFTKVSEVNKIQLTPNDYSGEYVIKILLESQNSSEERPWIVQSISRLSVN